MELVLNKEKKLALWHTMQRIRSLQLAIEAEYHLDQMKTPVHLYVGQEAIAAGICANLRADDYISSNHRSHGHYLAKGGDLKALVAELFCREAGCSKGRGGSMHLVDTKVGHLGSSSIVGGGIPLGTGQALAVKLMKEDKVSAVFFGDGAHDEGVIYESVNFAILKRLPVVYILENNQLSVCSRRECRWGTESPFLRYDPDQLWSTQVDGNDVNQVFQAGLRAVARARGGQGPSFIECVTYRLRGHAGAGHDAHLGYRSLEEIARWEAKDPIINFKRQLLAEGVLTRDQAAAQEEEIEDEVQDAFALAKAAPLPRGEDVNLYLFSEA